MEKAKPDFHVFNNILYTLQVISHLGVIKLPTVMKLYWKMVWVTKVNTYHFLNGL